MSYISILYLLFLLGAISTINACSSNNDCPDGEYCEFETGECNMNGNCTKIQRLCSYLVLPVCGCDGRNYSSPCEASSSGVSVDHHGSCSEAPRTCQNTTDCGPGEFCSKSVGKCNKAGTCVSKQALCSDLFDPVCGCDGRNYSSSCWASASGVSVDHIGYCSCSSSGSGSSGAPRSCHDSTDCNQGEFCSTTVGKCNQAGTCAAKQVICTDIFNPVCGCDGRNYSSSCQASASGVSVSHNGDCSGSSSGSGGAPRSCHDSTDCRAGEYCSTPLGKCQQTGTCAAKQVICSDLVNPVCGCDGRNYPNSCRASASGVSVDHTGDCSSSGGAPRSCHDSTDCNQGEFCSTTVGKCNQAGTCATKQVVCSDLFNPVCGCDGRNYSSSCWASASGVSVSHNGDCSGSGSGSGGAPQSCHDSTDCNQGEYCSKPVGECQQTGSCQAKEVVCPDLVSPVCGCDGRNYTNSCRASVSGVSVDHTGDCSGPSRSCMNTTDCNPGEYCSRSLGQCHQSGTCATKPQICYLAIYYVCGCDGKTYDNGCVAGRNGICIAHTGKC